MAKKNYKTKHYVSLKLSVALTLVKTIWHTFDMCMTIPLINSLIHITMLGYVNIHLSPKPFNLRKFWKKFNRKKSIFSKFTLVVLNVAWFFCSHYSCYRIHHKSLPQWQIYLSRKYWLIKEFLKSQKVYEIRFEFGWQYECSYYS